MADCDRIIYPDEEADLKNVSSQHKHTDSNSIEEPPTMADNDRVVFPDECIVKKTVANIEAKIVSPDEYRAMKEAAAKAANEHTEDETNSIEEPEGIEWKNAIIIPPNCPEGYVLDNGVCREKI